MTPITVSRLPAGRRGQNWRRWKLHGRIFLAGGLALLASPAPAQPDGIRPPAPQRLVSLNLCTDQYLLLLADRQQIAGLSPNAADPGMSAAASAAQGLPLLSWSAEEILAIHPDLVLGMPAKGSAILQALPRRQYPTLDLGFANSLADIMAQIERVATAIGHEPRGQALVARMQSELATIGRPGNGRVAAYYQRGGFLTGSGTLVDELMTRVGLVNLAHILGRGPLSRLSIEELVAAKPDFLILDTESGSRTDAGAEMLQHPALADIPRIYLPQAWTNCGGPAYVDAARRLAEAVSAK